MKTSYECAKELHQFKTLRCLLVEDASVYSHHVVPYSKIVFQEVNSTFDLFISMDDIDDFTDNVEELTRDTEKIHSALLFVSELNMQALSIALGRDIVAKKLIQVLQEQEEAKKLIQVLQEQEEAKKNYRGVSSCSKSLC